MRIGLDRSLAGATAEQREVHDSIARGPRGCVPSPFLAMLDRPPLAEAIQQVGVRIRFSGVLSEAQRELAILTTAAAVGCGYEWTYHAPLAADAGLDQAVIAGTLNEAAPPADAPWQTIIDFSRALARTHHVPPAVFDAALAVLGRQGVTELIAIVGYYSLLANFIILGGHDVSLPAN